MKLQVLISAMYQEDHSLLEKMNIQSEAIVINQCNRYHFEEIRYKEKKVRFISLDERGVGLSRNNALMRATADICLFADEDVTYVEGYEKMVVRAFENNPKADVILFNVPSKNPLSPTYVIPQKTKVRKYNCLRYGAVKIAIRTDRIRQANIYYSLLFGGGAKYGSGEDSLFVAECVNKGLNVYADPQIIGYVSQEESSWFEGYTKKYFFDKGVFFYCLNKKLSYILCLQLILRHPELCNKEISRGQAYRYMIEGIKSLKYTI